MGKIKKKLMILIVTFTLSGLWLQAGEKIGVQIRFYQGFKEEGAAVVVSSYYLTRLSKEHIISDVEIEKEKKSLMNIYNLKEVKILSTVNLELPKGKNRKHSQEIVLGGRELVLNLITNAKEENRFKVEVLDKKNPSPPLMVSEFMMPQEKTAVLGFQDSGGKIYFLSFHRKKDHPAPAKPVASIQYPRLIKSVEPVYPEKAMALELEGHVLIEAVMSESGRLEKFKILESEHELLNRAALAAVKQWVYRPFYVNGKPQSTDLTVKIIFKLRENQEKKE